ncbi:MAG: hypothetical protein LBI17_04220 [Rickettsiales bacterium]|nr:hypothetical protein [Rickettsiales bacterium]
MNVVSEVAYIKRGRSVFYPMSNGFPLSVDSYIYEDKSINDRYRNHLEAGSHVIFTDGSYVPLSGLYGQFSRPIGVGGWSFGVLSPESWKEGGARHVYYSGMTFASGSGIMELYSIKEALKYAAKNYSGGTVTIFSDGSSFLNKMIDSVKRYDRGANRSVNERLMDKRVRPEAICDHNDIMDGFNIVEALSEKSLFKYITSLLLACNSTVRFCWVPRRSNQYAKHVDNYSKAARIGLQRAVVSTLGEDIARGRERAAS